MVNTATTAITPASMMQVVQIAGREAQILDFSKFATAAADAPAKAAKPAPAKKEKKEGGQKPKPAAKEEKKHEEAIQYSREKNFSLWYSQVITKA